MQSISPLARFRKQQTPPLSPSALARELEISRSFLLRLESGERKASPKLLAKIKERCNIAPSEMRPDLAAAFSEAAE